MSIGLDSQAVLACHNTSMLLLFLLHLGEPESGVSMRAYCTSRHADLIARLQGVQSASAKDDVLDHPRKCSTRVLRALGTLRCDEAAVTRIISAMPSLDLQSTIAQSHTAFEILMWSLQARIVSVCAALARAV